VITYWELFFVAVYCVIAGYSIYQSYQIKELKNKIRLLETVLDGVATDRLEIRRLKDGIQVTSSKPSNS
jgi:hypothetical protein